MSKIVVSERLFTAQIIALARWYKWRVAHFRPAQTKSGRWLTAVQGDGAGFPDLVMARRGVVLYAELKSAKGRLSPAQIAWGKELPNMRVWRPSDIDEIEAILR